MNIRLPLVLLSVFVLLVAPGVALAFDIQGRVVGIADGDTITVLQDRQPFKIGLQHVDAPELHGQPYGPAAKRFTSDLVFGKEVHVHTEQQDRYGRWLGVVTLPNGLVLNQALVQAGYAWWYRQYSTDRTYGTLEAEAQAEHRGLWQDPHPLAPWTFRHQEAVLQ
jgi:endonuclease YncB( thermonuclease family)